MFNSVYIHNDTIGLSEFLGDKGYNISKIVQPEMIVIYCGDTPPEELCHIWMKNADQKMAKEHLEAFYHMRKTNTRFVIISNMEDGLCELYAVAISNSGLTHKFTNQYELWCYLPTLMDTIHG